ncbi:MAG: tRNA 5-hydroxyuridine methyltransferase [Chlamydiae bacterium]|nr:tRNA 5-hydroxyuridine methyltransferase [Chlamydiota bacterium]
MLLQPIKQYLESHARPLSESLQKIQKETGKTFEGSHMLCGTQVASLLSILIKVMRAKYVVDIGTYVGFSALAMAEALEPDGKVISCERDALYFKTATKNVNAHPDGHKVELFYGNAIDCIDQIEQPLDLSFLDADKTPYLEYYQKLVEKTRPGGLIIIDDALWKGEVVEATTPRLHLMNQFNEYVEKDTKVESLLIPIRHGINLVYKL